MKRLPFYLTIAVLAVLDSLLLSSPNLLGKMGLLIYKFHYLRTFPRALLTVVIVVSIAIFISEVIRTLVRKRMLGRSKGALSLLAMIAACGAIIYKTVLDFSRWTVSHTGLRFKYGAYLLPVVLLLIFVYALVSLPKPRRSNLTRNSDDN